MTPNTPSSSDGSSLPPRQRPNLADLAKDSTEQDLWAFDDAEELEESPECPPRKPVESSIPKPREEAQSKPVDPLARESPLYPKTPEGRDRIKLNVGRNRRQISSQAAPASHPRPGNEFEELDKWEDTDPAVTGEDSVPPISAPGAMDEDALGVPEPIPAAVEADDSRDEFSPPPAETAARVPLPQLGLSKVERTGLILLLAFLVIGAGIVFINSINRLPSGAEVSQFRDFPVEGKLLTIVGAETFWREPSTADTVRRGTQLLPAIKLTVRGGPAALRVFFRDTEGNVVGDAVSRSVGEAGTLEITATAGFDEMWMHDTYSTTGVDLWTIEILEGPSQGSPTAEFNTLLKMNVSTERR